MDPNDEMRNRRWRAEIIAMEMRFPTLAERSYPEFDAEVARRIRLDCLLHKYRRQGRPQAHLDRVMRLGRV